MASPNERTRNNIRMGLFVTFALLLAMMIVFALSDVWSKVTQQTEEWTVRFPIRSGVMHIKPGSEVRVGGVELGRVVAVEPHFPDDPSRAFEFVDVIFQLERRVQLYDDAMILASSQLIGAEGWIDIPNVGTPAAGQPEDGILRGTETEGLLAALLGPSQAAKTEETIDHVHLIVRDMTEFSEFLTMIPDEYHDRIVPIIDDVKDTTDRTRTMVVDLTEQTWPRWREHVDAALANVETATENAKRLVDDGRDVAADVRDVIGENRPHLLATMENADQLTDEWLEITDHVREDVVPRVTNLLESGQDGLDRAVAAIQRLREDYEGWSVTLGETLAAANLTGQQLKLASIELRRAPWKLLHRPSQRELEHELLYEAARTFAMASADLKAASNSVQRVLDNYGEEIIDDPEARERLQRSILDPVDGYIKAQERLMDILFIDAPRR